MELKPETIQELIVVCIDKGLLAVIVVLAIYFLNRLLEKYKSSLSRDNNIIHERFLSIGETWKKIYRWIVESNLDGGPIGQKETVDERNQRFNKILTNGEEVLKYIKEQRFINGTEITNEMLIYANKYYENYRNMKMEKPVEFDFHQLDKNGSDLVKEHYRIINIKSK